LQHHDGVGVLLVGVEGHALEHARGSDAVLVGVDTGAGGEGVRVLCPGDLVALLAQLGGERDHPPGRAVGVGGVEFIVDTGGEKRGLAGSLGQGPQVIEVFLGFGQVAFQGVEAGLCGVEACDDVLFQRLPAGAFVAGQ